MRTASISGRAQRLPRPQNFFLLRARPKTGALTIKERVAKFLLTTKNDGCHAKYLRVQGHLLGKFAKHLSGRGAHAIEKQEIVDWFDAQKWALRTRDTYRIDFGNLFGFAVKEGHCAANPLATMGGVRYDEPEIGIVTVAEASELLNAAAETERGRSCAAHRFRF